MDAIDNAIAHQAANWFIAHREGSLSAVERTAFTEWLRASPLHIREYLAVASLARDVVTAATGDAFSVEQLLAAAEAETEENVVHGHSRFAHVAQTHTPQYPRSRARTPVIVAALGTAAAAVAIAIWNPALLQHLTGAETLRTAHGEQRIWRLADGSVVHLNSGSALSVRFTDTERRIELAQGQVLFDVAHEPQRRFRVTAGSAEVVAVGTSFDVYRKGEATIVTVVEGKVAVDDNTVVEAGEQLRLTQSAAQAAPERTDVGKATAWTQQQIVFDQERLADVAAEFNRYGRLPIDIEDIELRDLRITGIFNAYDTDSFLGFLDKLEGVDIETREDRIRVARASAL